MNASPMAQVRIRGWNPGLKKISMTKTLQMHCGISLSEAKRVTDRVLAGEVVAVEVEGQPEANELVARLNELGAVGSIE